MTERHKYLIAYDVCQPSRLYRVYKYLTGYKVGGQKSVFEILATVVELKHIHAELVQLMNAEEDRLHIIRLDPRMKPRCLGSGKTYDQTWFGIL